MQRYLVPARQARVEMRVVNSRFVSTAAPAFTVSEARTFIARIRDEFAGASHNVAAYLVGHGATVIAHCGDDGEPSGTAGRPALAVLRGSGLGDVAVVVTRFFGGTKLGTGGLVRAYGDAVRQVLAVLPRAERVPTHTVLLVVPYGLFERTRWVIEAHGGQVADQEFGADVTLTVRFPVDRFSAFQAALREMSRGTLQAVIVETEEAIVPVNGPHL
jgi:uncharacterized YigZ family protein